MWKAAVPSGTIADQLLVNGQRQTLARYPNAKPGEFMGGVTHWSDVQAHASVWPGGCVGAFIHGRHLANWGSAHSVVTGVDAVRKQLTHDGGRQVNQRPGFDGEALFIEGALGALDVPGEWFLDTKASTLWFMPPAGLVLATARIEVVRTPSLVRVVGTPGQAVHDIIFRGLRFEHAARTFMQTGEALLRGDWCIARQGALFIENAERV